jgi:hypothetical protein
MVVFIACRDPAIIQFRVAVNAASTNHVSRVHCALNLVIDHEGQVMRTFLARCGNTQLNASTRYIDEPAY